MLTAEPLGEAFWQRAQRLTRLRREEQQQMRDYVALTSGHMEFLIHALDGEVQEYTPPDLPPLASTERRECRSYRERRGGSIVPPWEAP